MYHADRWNICHCGSTNHHSNNGAIRTEQCRILKHIYSITMYVFVRHELQGWKWVRWPGQSGSLGLLLVGQVGLIYKLNYLDLTWYHMFFRKQCWHLVSEWTLDLMNALKYHWCETSLSSQAVLEHVVSKDRSMHVQETGSVSCQEWRNLCMALFHIKKFSRHVTLLFKRNFIISVSSVGHLLCGSVGQMDQQVLPTFNPDEL